MNVIFCIWCCDQEKKGNRLIYRIIFTPLLPVHILPELLPLWQDFQKMHLRFLRKFPYGMHIRDPVFPSSLKNCSDNGTKRRISSYMAIAVIDLFKIVHVDHSYSPHLIQEFQLFLKISPVSGTSQRIFI